MKHNSHAARGPLAAIGWTAFVAKRYILRKRNRSRSPAVLSILGIATGVLSLTVIISVMNGFQLGFIESIIEISSYHARVYNFPKENSALLSDIQNLNGVQSAVLFSETKGLLRGKDRLSQAAAEAAEDRQSVVLIRGIPPGADIEDKGMAARLEFEKGGFDLEQRGSILLGSELAASLGLRPGDECEFISVSNFLPRDNGLRQARFTVRGIFRTGFFEYDSNWAFVNLEDALALENDETNAAENDEIKAAENNGLNAAENESANVMLGIKLKYRDMDRQFVQQAGKYLQAYLGSDVQKNDIRINSWRDYNKAFFNALRTEKLMMFVLVGLIFIITAMNIYHSQRRLVLERGEEIALLRAVGASPFAVRMVFTLNGCMLGALGATCGMIPALLIVTHIRAFFSGIEAVVNGVLNLGALVTGGLPGGEGYEVFSPAIFYLKEIPARAIPHEIVLIYMFGFLSAVIAAFTASGRVSLIRPAETLRYE